MSTINTKLLDLALRSIDAYVLVKVIAKLDIELVVKAITIMNNDDMHLLHDIRDIVIRSGKIEAIKRYRELTDLGLKEAKDWVEYQFKDEIESFTRRYDVYEEACIHSSVDRAAQLYANDVGVSLSEAQQWIANRFHYL
jgi:ribosomal protein L7/L12